MHRFLFNCTDNTGLVKCSSQMTWSRYPGHPCRFVPEHACAREHLGVQERQLAVVIVRVIGVITGTHVGQDVGAKQHGDLCDALVYDCEHLVPRGTRKRTPCPFQSTCQTGPYCISGWSSDARCKSSYCPG